MGECVEVKQETCLASILDVAHGQREPVYEQDETLEVRDLVEAALIGKC